MKTISIFTIGAFVSNMASAHPNLFYLILSIALGIILGAITSVIFVGPSIRKQPPTPAKRQANVTQTPVRKTAKRQAKKQSQMQYGIEIFNYPTTQGAYA